MKERIEPPKLPGHENENVFDLGAYRALITRDRTDSLYRADLLASFDAAAESYRMVEIARDPLEMTRRVDELVHMLSKTLEGRADFPADESARVRGALDLARGFSRASRALHAEDPSPSWYANLVRETKQALVNAIRELYVTLKDIGPGS